MFNNDMNNNQNFNNGNNNFGNNQNMNGGFTSAPGSFKQPWQQNNGYQQPVKKTLKILMKYLVWQDLLI